MDEVVLKLLGLLEQLVEERGVPKKEAAIDKNIVQSPNSPLANGKKPSPNLTSFEKKKLTESFNLFNKLFFDYKKKVEPDTKEKTKVSTTAKKQLTPPPLPKQAEKKGSILSMLGMAAAGIAALVGGLSALVMGLMDNGPFKGILKLISKFGLSGGIKLLKGAIKPFLEIAGKVLKYPLKILSKLGKFLGKGFAKVGKFLFGGIAKQASKIFGKIGGGGLMKMMGKFLGKFAKVFKRIPVIGTIISIAFAYSRFKSGDVVGGTIDVLSGLAGLVDIVLPGVGTALSIGLDILNAVLDVKSNQGEGKPPKSKMTILKDMASSVGNWIWDNRMYIPILSSVNRFMMSWDAFKSGDISGGFANFGLALSNLVTGVDGEKIMEGISGFMGLFDSGSKEGGTPKPNKSFISEMSSVVGEKIVELWEWIKQKVKDGIAGLIPGGKAALEFAKSTANSTKELTSYVADKAKGAYDKTKSVVGNLWDSIAGKAKETSNTIVKQAEKVLTSSGVSSGMESLAKKQDVLVRGTEKISSSLYELNIEANRYLRIIANNTTMLLHKPMGGGGGKGSNVIVNQPSSPPKQSVTIPNNRDGYISSAYALG